MSRTHLIILALLGLLLGTPPLRADSLVSLPDPLYSDDGANTQSDLLSSHIGAIIYPTLGFPSVLRPGDELRLHVRLNDGGATTAWIVRLRTARDPKPQTYDLSVTGQDYDPVGLYRLRLRLSADLPREVYDLELATGRLAGGFDIQANAVRVVEGFAENFDFIHIADSQTQDYRVTVKGVVERGLDEIRFRDPEFTVFSGDWNFGVDYPREYDENHAIWVAGRVPCFLVPGNHDGYTRLDARPQGPPDLRYDGLNHWRRTAGPLYYSFDYGDRLHFVAVNSYDGDPQRRNTESHALPMNYGGQVDPAQMAWLEADLKAAAGAGRDSVLFMHHNPRGPYLPNEPGFPFRRLALVKRASQEWNDEPSGKELQRLVETYGVTHVLMGHTHQDGYDVQVLNAGTPAQRSVHWVTTTTMSITFGNDIGYRIIQVRGGRIVEVRYDPPKLGSVPFDARGKRLEIETPTPNDGSALRVVQRITNRYARDVTGRIKCFLAPSPQGYRVSGGTLQRLARADDGSAVAYVRVTAVAGQTTEVIVEEAGPGGAVAAPVTTADGGDLVINSAPAPASAWRSSRGTGGCALAAPAGGLPLALWPWLALLLLITRRRS